MYNMIIVDDEDMIREGMRDVVDWNKYNIKILGTASNGVEALDMLKEDVCDIMLVDIRMPVMDGLTLTNKVKEKYPNTKILILTAHDEFQYAQEAIKAGAFDYILKIGGEEELVLSIKKVIDSIDKERKEERYKSEIRNKLDENMPFIKENCLRKLLKNDIKEEEIQLKFAEFDIKLNQKFFMSLIVAIDDYYIIEQTYLQSEIKEILNKAADLLKEYLLPKKIYSHSVMLNEASIVIVINSPFKHGLSEEIKNACKTIKLRSKETLGNNTFSMGIGTVYDTITGMRKSYLEAMTTLENKFFYGKNSIIEYIKIKSISSDDYKYPLELEEKIITDIQTGNKVLAIKNIDSFFAELTKNKEIASVHLKKACVELLVVITRIVTEMQEKIDDVLERRFIPHKEVEALDTIDDVQEMIKQVVVKVADVVSNKYKNNGTRAVQAVMNYIDNYYKYNLSVKSLADKVYMSPSYLASVFKQKTGETIVYYLNKVRVMKAKELLENNMFTVSQISEMVGFNDPAYFSRIFKKYFEISPADYREDII